MKRSLYLLLCMTAMVLLLPSCQSKPKEEKHELRIGVMSSMDFVPLAVAREMGYFDKHNITVDIQKFYSANDRDAAFQSGNIDGTVIDYTGAVLQKAGGVDLKITSACNATFCIMTGPSSGIVGLQELKKKRISVSRNTVIDYCVDVALHSVGLNPDEVEKQEINKIPVRFEMLMGGQSDATALPDPFITMAVAKGAKKLISMDDLDCQVTGFMFKTSVLDQKSDEMRAFYAAYNEAVAYIKTHSKEDIKNILVKDIGFPEALVGSVDLPDYTPAQMPRDKDLEAVVEWLKQKKVIKEEFSSEGLTDNRFISH